MFHFLIHPLLSLYCIEYSSEHTLTSFFTSRSMQGSKQSDLGTRRHGNHTSWRRLDIPSPF